MCENAATAVAANEYYCIDVVELLIVFIVLLFVYDPRVIDCAMLMLHYVMLIRFYISLVYAHIAMF